MRFLKHLLLVLFASTFLVACGDGGSDSSSSAGSSGSSSNLIAAYDKINKGTSYAQVQAIVGYAHNGGQDQAGHPSLGTWYKWSASDGTAILSIAIGPSGAAAKIIASTTVTSSKTF